MRLFFVYSYYYILEVFRQPAYVITTLLFPSMFFWFFGIPNAVDAASAQLLMGSFAAFSVLSVTVYQMSVAIAQERGLSWNRYQRILPVSAFVILFSRLVASLLLALLAVGAVVLTAHIFSETQIAFTKWPGFLLAILLGALPFAALGLIIGFYSTPRTALTLANMVYLPLSFAGGLWMPPHILPQAVQNISQYLPTRFYGEWVWSSLLDEKTVDQKYLYGLLVYFIVFSILALFIYKRDQGHRYK